MLSDDFRLRSTVAALLEAFAGRLALAFFSVGRLLLFIWTDFGRFTPADTFFLEALEALATFARPAFLPPTRAFAAPALFDLVRFDKESTALTRSDNLCFFKSRDKS